MTYIGGELPKAEKILDVRDAFDDGALLVIRVWRGIDPVTPSIHRFEVRRIRSRSKQ
jgi:hypothetical protein